MQRLAQQNRLELPHDRRRERQEVFRAAGEEVEPVQPVQPSQLAERIGVVVDADVDIAVVQAQIPAVLPHHEQRRRLHAAPVSTTRLPGDQRRHQPVGERPRSALERLRHVLHGLVGHHDVRLRREAPPDDHLALTARPPDRLTADSPPGPIEARIPRPACGVAARIHHPHLPLRRARIAAHHHPQRLRRARPHRHQRETVLPVVGVAEGLRGDRAHTCLPPGDDAPDVRKLGLHGHAQVTGRGVVGDDAVGVRALETIRRA